MPDIARVCRITGERFFVTELEQELCRKFSVPLATTSPSERLRHLLAFSNLSSLYRGVCSASGKSILRIFPPEVPHPVFEAPYWWSDEWDAVSFGRSYDFRRPFFEQFAELQKVVPWMNLLVNYVTVENCDYVCGAGYSKNCYLMFNANRNEDCYFCYTVNYSTDCIDCTTTSGSELCYDCTFVENSYDLRHAFNCKNCNESAFLWNCIGCTHCFCSVNLRHKKFCFLNEQLSEEEYHRKISEIQLDSWDVVEHWRQRFLELAQQHPQPAIRGVELERAEGDFISHCQNVSDCFESWELQDCANCMKMKKAKDCLDVYSWGEDIELICRTSRCGYQCQNVLCSYLIYSNCSNIEYSMNCVSCSHCFGCIGLRNKSYCILNKQYQKDEYFDLRKRIIVQMNDAECSKGLPAYGEFFPYELSMFPFNDSDAMLHFPLSDSEARQRGAVWVVKETEESNASFDWSEVPDRTLEVDDSITKETLICQKTGKAYRITSKELEKYKSRGLPLPRLHWRERMLLRQELLNAPQTFEQKCAKSGETIKSSFPPNGPWQVWNNRAFTELFD